MMDNHKLHEEAQAMADQYSGYALARHLLKERDNNAKLHESLDAKDRIIRAQEATGNALAAHVEAIKAAWSEPAERHAQTVDRVFTVLERGPRTSLAQRDARMKAEALDELYELWSPNGNTSLVYVDPDWTKDRANEYRQQAEGGE